MKIHFLKIYNSIITLLLSVIGFSSCTQSEPDEYGTPKADYVVRGKVTSSVNDQAVKGIEALIPTQDTAITDNDGNYTLSTGGIPRDTLYIEFIDPNNSFQKTDTFVNFKDANFTGGDGHWYKGKATKELNIKLKPENDGK